MTENNVRLGALLRYFLWLGAVGFGGPVVLVDRMRADLEETRHWYTPAEYREGLALAQLAPGPLAAQLAIYLGWVRAGLLGATLVGIAFVGPSFVMVVLLSAAYVRFGGLPWMHGAFYGIGASVIAVIAQSAVRLVRKTVGADRLLWLLVFLNAVLTAWTEREIVSLIVASGVLVPTWRELAHSRTVAASVVIVPSWLLTGIHGTATKDTLTTITVYFAKAGALRRSASSFPHISSWSSSHDGSIVLQGTARCEP